MKKIKRDKKRINKEDNGDTMKKIIILTGLMFLSINSTSMAAVMVQDKATGVVDSLDASKPNKIGINGKYYNIGDSPQAKAELEKIQEGDKVDLIFNKDKSSPDAQVLMIHKH